ncbi:MAG: hypothetical protein QNJ65_19860 [Xenococcaceae cyanobacterium MO_234.B1]|nr:hypothetical protein [Xenococcaceae cyanobacterium MO_234.B1]
MSTTLINCYVCSFVIVFCAIAMCLGVAEIAIKQKLLRAAGGIRSSRLGSTAEGSTALTR